MCSFVSIEVESCVLHGALTRLADEEANVISEDGRVAVKEVTGQFHHDGQLCQLL